jgi:hypothetical protein
MERGKYSIKVINHGQEVWDHLAANPGGLSMKDLTELTKLTQGQVRKAMEYIRDIFATSKDQPIIFIPGRRLNLYKLTDSPVETQDDLLRRLAIWRIQIQRARTAIAMPGMAKFNGMAELHLLTEHMGYTERMLDVLLTKVATSAAA